MMRKGVVEKKILGGSRNFYIYGLHYVIDIDLGDMDTATSGVSSYMVRALDDLFTRFCTCFISVKIPWQ
jgi:hypothetical protein